MGELIQTSTLHSHSFRISGMAIEAPLRAESLYLSAAPCLKFPVFLSACPHLRNDDPVLKLYKHRHPVLCFRAQLYAHLRAITLFAQNYGRGGQEALFCAGYNLLIRSLRVSTKFRPSPLRSFPTA